MWGISRDNSAHVTLIFLSSRDVTNTFPLEHITRTFINHVANWSGGWSVDRLKLPNLRNLDKRPEELRIHRFGRYMFWIMTLCTFYLLGIFYIRIWSHGNVSYPSIAEEESTDKVRTVAYLAMISANRKPSSFTDASGVILSYSSFSALFNNKWNGNEHLSWNKQYVTLHGQ